MSTKPFLTVENLEFSYGAERVLRGVSFSVCSATITALIGLNGAGKSTLFKCLTRQLGASGGSITLGGRNIADYLARDFAAQTSYVRQMHSLSGTDISVRDFLVEGRTPFLSHFSVPGREDYLRAGEIAERLEITALLDRAVSELSGGQYQLAALGRALVQETPLIILDEPMSALDMSCQVRILELFRQLRTEGKTILFSTHNPDHALRLGCDCILLSGGMVRCSGKADDVLTDVTLSSIFGNAVSIRKIDGEEFCTLQLTN